MPYSDYFGDYYFDGDDSIWDEEELDECDDEYDDEQDYDEYNELREAEIRHSHPLKSCKELMEEYGIEFGNLSRDENGVYNFSLIFKEV